MGRLTGACSFGCVILLTVFVVDVRSEIEIPGVHAGFVERVMKGIYGGNYLYIWVREPLLCHCHAFSIHRVD